MRERIKKANKLREMLRSVLKWRKTIEFINGVNKSLGGVAEKTGLVEAREAGTAQRKSAVPRAWGQCRACSIRVVKSSAFLKPITR